MFITQRLRAFFNRTSHGRQTNQPEQQTTASGHSGSNNPTTYYRIDPTEDLVILTDGNNRQIVPSTDQAEDLVTLTGGNNRQTPSPTYRSLPAYDSLNRDRHRLLQVGQEGISLSEARRRMERVLHGGEREDGHEVPAFLLEQDGSDFVFSPAGGRTRNVVRRSNISNLRSRFNEQQSSAELSDISVSNVLAPLRQSGLNPSLQVVRSRNGRSNRPNISEILASFREEGPDSTDGA